MISSREHPPKLGGMHVPRKATRVLRCESARRPRAARAPLGGPGANAPCGWRSQGATARPAEELGPSLSKGWDDPAEGAVALGLPDDPEAAALVQDLFDEWHPRRERWAAMCKPDRNLGGLATR